MIVRGIPRGSLEQVIFRVDALHALVARGVTCVNGPRAIERTVDKFLASALLARAGVPTPRTIACERPEDALEAFEELGGDVIVKPLFGSMGAGMTRVDDADVAYRVFHALALERAVYYLQETLPHDGRDLRAFVVGGRVLAAIERVGPGWRANLARGARARADGAERRAGAHVPGGRRGAGRRLRGRRPAARRRREYVLELNGIPGWHGLQEATGADVAAALVAHLEAVVSEARPARAPDDAAVQRRRDERARRAGVARARAGPRRRARRRRRAARARRRRRGARRSARRPAPRRCPPAPGRGRSPRAVPARCSRATASSAGRPASRGSGDSARPSRRSTLRTTSGSSASSRSSASAPVSVSVPTITRCAPSSSSARARSGSLTPASTMTRASRASARDRRRRCRRAPVIASRSATYSSSSPSSTGTRGRARAGRRLPRSRSDRAIAFALAAHGVHRRAVLEIDDSDDAHAGAR